MFGQGDRDRAGHERAEPAPTPRSDCDDVCIAARVQQRVGGGSFDELSSDWAATPGTTALDGPVERASSVDSSEVAGPSRFEIRCDVRVLPGMNDHQFRVPPIGLVGGPIDDSVASRGAVDTGDDPPCSSFRNSPSDNDGAGALSDGLLDNGPAQPTSRHPGPRLSHHEEVGRCRFVDQYITGIEICCDGRELNPRVLRARRAEKLFERCPARRPETVEVHFHRYGRAGQNPQGDPSDVCLGCRPPHGRGRCG